MMPPEGNRQRADIEDIIFKAQETLLRDGDHPLTIIIQGSLKQVTEVLPGVPETHEEKIDYMWVLGQHASNGGQIGELQKVFLTSKASFWEESKDIHLDFALSDDSKRKEILYVGGIDLINRRKHLILLELARDKRGQISKYTDLLANHSIGLPLETPLEDAFVSGFHAVYIASSS